MILIISKKLLNISESCEYLGISRRTLARLECSDPTFPKRKTKTKHSRELLEAWLAQNGPSWYAQPDPQPYGRRTRRFAFQLQSLN
jgi:hypothetical protein